MAKSKKAKNVKVKNTNKVPVLLSAELGLSLAAGEVMVLSGDLLKKALKVKGVKKSEDEIGVAAPPVKKK